MIFMKNGKCYVGLPGSKMMNRKICFINLGSVVLLTAELRKGLWHDTASYSTGL